ncbi:hypothetical protein KQI52_09675 [bacterium]|nr:hypothetical protein [bacterium]
MATNRLVVLAILLLGFVLAGCGERDTGERRIDMKLWYYDPPQKVADMDDSLRTEILVFADEHWDGWFSDSYNPVTDAVIELNDDRIFWRASWRGYYEANVLFGPESPVDLYCELTPSEHYAFRDSIPDLNVWGLPSGRDTTLAASDTLLITWNQVGDQQGRLDIIKGEDTIESVYGKKRLRWSPKSSYRGERYQMVFRFTYVYPSMDPFNVMQYQYVGKHFVNVE